MDKIKSITKILTKDKYTKVNALLTIGVIIMSLFEQNLNALIAWVCVLYSSYIIAKHEENKTLDK